MRTDQSNSMGIFDFHNFIFEISGCDSRYRKTIEESLLSSSSIETTIKAINKKSIIIHEMTHFTDLTSTLWGVEYIFRKNYFINSLKNGLTLDTFMLNESEIALHSLATNILFPHRIIKNPKINFSIEYSERFGAILYLHFPEGKNLKLSIPVSMLALLEANATANEFLSRIESNKKLPKDKQTTITQSLEHDSSILMTNPESSEYNILIILSEVFFPFLEKETLLKYVACLCRICLNFDAFALSKLANIVEEICTLNIVAASALGMDLRRGQNRSSLFFFISTLIRSDLEKSIISYREVEDGLKASAYCFIKNYLKHRHGVLDDTKLESLEIEISIKELEKIDHFNDIKIVEETIKNRDIINKTPISLCNLEDIKLLDFYLSEDSSVASPPSRIDVDINDRWLETLDFAGEIEKHYTKFELSKDHLTPNHAIISHEYFRNNKYQTL